MVERRGSKVLKGEIHPVEAKVLENRFVHGMTLLESGRQAGLPCTTDNSMRVSAHQIVKKHKDANSEFLQSLNRLGVNPDTISEKIKQGLEATMVVKRKVAKDLEEFETVPDFHAQHKFTETVVDIMGAKAPKKVEIESKSFEQRLLEITMRQE